MGNIKIIRGVFDTKLELQHAGVIAYRAGNRWRFNKTLLTRLLEEEPEIFNNSRFEFA